MILEITQKYLRKEMNRIGVHPDSIQIFEKKQNIIPLKLFGVPFPAANIIKQEMLALGGDAAVHKNVIDGKVERSDILLFGTKKHYEGLMEKLSKMPFFGLLEIKKDLEEFFNKKRIELLISPWGRKVYLNNTLVMGIINVTPDSFYPESRKKSVEEVISTAEKMLKEGADILDIGGLSTRPGSEPVDEEEEQKRVIPAIKAVRESFPRVFLSVDTYRAGVAQKALENGADMINDISGFSFDERILDVVAETKAPYVLMHIKGTPKDMQQNPCYEDVINEITVYFYEKMQTAFDKGVDPEKIILDPGIGFGKRYEDNLEILSRIRELKSLKKPILIGHSRKSFIGKTLGDISPEDRLEGTLAITAMCSLCGVDIIRVHDVKENKRVLKMLEAVKCQMYSSPLEAM